MGSLGGGGGRGCDRPALLAPLEKENRSSVDEAGWSSPIACLLDSAGKEREKPYALEGLFGTTLRLKASPRPLIGPAGRPIAGDLGGTAPRSRFGKAKEIFAGGAGRDESAEGSEGGTPFEVRSALGPVGGAL